MTYHFGRQKGSEGENCRHLIKKNCIENYRHFTKKKATEHHFGNNVLKDRKQIVYQIKMLG